MEKKYTPGEWVVTQSGGLSLQVCLNDEDHTIVSSVWTCNPEDAHLISAAPDLLEALEGVMEYVEVHEDEGLCCAGRQSKELIEAISAARTALARYRGEA